jgi:photosystem II stability/assembly factor-like uncharacterized protein
MTKLLIYTLLIMALVQLSCSGSQRPVESRATTGITPPIQRVDFYGSDNVWVVTADQALMHTQDGGGNWTKIPGDVVNGFVDVSFIDASRGWAINRQAEVWRTTDAGRSWGQITKLTDDVFSAEKIFFLDELHGWALDPFLICRTEDGGYTWQSHSPSTRQRIETLLKYFFISTEIGWAGGSDGALYRTEDGGKSWQPQVVAPNGTDVGDVFFINEKTGWITNSVWGSKANKPIGGIYHTSDGGQTWLQQQLPGSDIVIESIHFIDENEGWSVGNVTKEVANGYDSKAIILHTTDGGKNWNYAQTQSDDPSYERVYFADQQRGWLVAEESIYCTDDSGKTWRLVLTLAGASRNPN